VQYELVIKVSKEEVNVFSVYSHETISNTLFVSQTDRERAYSL